MAGTAGQGHWRYVCSAYRHGCDPFGYKPDVAQVRLSLLFLIYLKRSLPDARTVQTARALTFEATSGDLRSGAGR